MSLLDMTLLHAFLKFLSSEEEEEELPNFQVVAVQTESTAAEMTGNLQTGWLWVPYMQAYIFV